MKEKLIAIFNTLKMVETKGDSTLVMADCLRELAQVINTVENEPRKEE